MSIRDPVPARVWQLPLTLVISTLVVVLPLPAILPRPLLDLLFAEDGIVETGSVVAFVGLALAAGLARPRRGGEGGIALAGLVLAARELDVNRRFTTMNIEKCLTLCYFAAAKVPVREKLVVGGILLLLLGYAAWTVRRWAPVFVRALSARAAPAVTAVVALAALVVSQLLDEGAHALRHVGWRGLADYPWVAGESLELVGPAMLVLAVLQRRPGLPPAARGPASRP